MTMVVDCDSHVMEPPDLWQEYLEPRYRDRAIRIETADGVEKLIIGEQVVLQGVLAGLGGAHVEREKLFGGGLGYMDGCPPASYDPAERVKMLDEWGVDVAVMFPTIGILPFPIDDHDLASAYCRAYNRWQVDFVAGAPGRVAPIAVVNWHDVDVAGEELDWCLARGFRGLFVPPEIIDGKRPGQEAFDPLWARLEEADVPGCLHVIVRFDGTAFQAWGRTRPGPVFNFALGGTGQLIPGMASLVVDGVMERFPRIKVVSVEAGCGYAAYLMDRLDEKVQFFRHAQSFPMLPSEYIQRNCYFVAEPEERTIGAMLDLVGEDRILWGSDFPHIDSTLEAPNLIRKSVAGLSEARQARVLGENARQVFCLGD